jgi:opacity protein-like surface antigen
MNRRAVAGYFFRIAVAGTMIALGAARPAAGQAFISPLIGYNFGGDAGCPEITGCEEKNLNLGVAVGSLGSVIGTELEFGYARDFFGETAGVSSSVLTLMGNVMLAPRFGPVQPYGVVGVGLIKTHVELDVAGLLESDNNHFGWDVGGGLMVFFSDHVGARGDIRYFHAFQDLSAIVGDLAEETKLDFGRASGSVVFRF